MHKALSSTWLSWVSEKFVQNQGSSRVTRRKSALVQENILQWRRVERFLSNSLTFVWKRYRVREKGTGPWKENEKGIRIRKNKAENRFLGSWWRNKTADQLIFTFFISSIAFVSLFALRYYSNSLWNWSISSNFLVNKTFCSLIISSRTFSADHLSFGL